MGKEFHGRFFRMCKRLESFRYFYNALCFNQVRHETTAKQVDWLETSMWRWQSEGSQPRQIALPSDLQQVGEVDVHTDDAEIRIESHGFQIPHQWKSAHFSPQRDVQLLSITFELTNITVLVFAVISCLFLRIRKFMKRVAEVDDIQKSDNQDKEHTKLCINMIRVDENTKRFDIISGLIERNLH